MKENMTKGTIRGCISPRQEIYTTLLSESIIKRDRIENLGIDGRNILK
jgi:hypothetical protein